MYENSRKALLPGLLAIIFFANTGAQVLSAQADLKEHLMTIERHAGERGADLNKLETEALNLTQQFRSPEDMGKIYAEIAQLYRVSIKSGTMRDRDSLIKIRNYSAKALEYPLDYRDHVRAYMDMGTAVWGLADDTSEEWPRYRRDIAISFLGGLKLLLDNGIPSEPIPLPGVGKIDCDDPNNPICQALQKEHDRELVARRRAEEINDLQLLRALLTDNLVGAYTVDGQATKELEEIAQQILSDDAMVSSLLDKVRVARAHGFKPSAAH